MRDEPGDEYDVKRAFARDLIRDMDIPALASAGLGYHTCKPPPSQKSSQQVSHAVDALVRRRSQGPLPAGPLRAPTPDGREPRTTNRDGPTEQADDPGAVWNLPMVAASAVWPFP